MSYDLDILAPTVEDRASAQQALIDFLTGRANYEAFGTEEFAWTQPGSENGMTIGLMSDADHDDPELEDDPRTIGYLSFNYFRDGTYYNAVMDELQAILSAGPYEFHDPQADCIWTDQIDPEVISGGISDVQTAIPMARSGGLLSRLFGRKS